MNRNRFTTSLLALASIPFTGIAKMPSLFKRTGKGIKIAKGEGRIHGHLQLSSQNDSVVDVKISGSDTDGDLAVYEQRVSGKGAGVPLHIHNEDEMFFVLDGRFRFKVGDDIQELEAGDSIFLPRHVPHAWLQLSDTGKVTFLMQPAGKLENIFVTLASLKATPAPEEFRKILAANGVNVVGPRLTLE